MVGQLGGPLELAAFGSLARAGVEQVVVSPGKLIVLRLQHLPQPVLLLHIGAGTKPAQAAAVA